MSDRLALANAIEAAGIDRTQAENIATAIAHFVEGNAATKADVREAVQQLTLRGIYGLITAGGILFAALHMWPPHG